MATAALLALSTRASADPLPLGATSGVISVRFDDAVTGGVLPAQCVNVQPGGQLCDGAAGDEDTDAGEISVTQPFGSYIVGYDPVNQPADRLVKAPTVVACELTAKSAACTVVYAFNPLFISPPSYPTPANLFLTTQDGSVAPPTCAAATDTVTFTHTLPYAPSNTVGGFDMEVVFDPALVCVDLEPGAYFQETPGSTCVIDDVESIFEIAGRAHIYCDVVGVPPTTSSSLEMAVVHVRAQPVQYASILANQDNGLNALVLNQSCNLVDLNSEPIPMLACDDHEVTIRRLEADVTADCAVDVRDIQLLAYRWGSPIRILILDPLFPRLDLEPADPPPPGDGKLDILDLQFIYGRHGSTCEMPHPNQPPRSSY